MTIKVTVIQSQSTATARLSFDYAGNSYNFAGVLNEAQKLCAAMYLVNVDNDIELNYKYRNSNGQTIVDSTTECTLVLMSNYRIHGLIPDTLFETFTEVADWLDAKTAAPELATHLRTQREFYADNDIIITQSLVENMRIVREMEGQGHTLIGRPSEINGATVQRYNLGSAFEW